MGQSLTATVRFQTSIAAATSVTVTFPAGYAVGPLLAGNPSPLSAVAAPANIDAAAVVSWNGGAPKVVSAEVNVSCP